MLNKALGYKSNTLSYIRQGKSLPSDDTMLQLALLAGENQEQALINLNIWRNTGPAQSLYLRMAQRLKGAMQVLLVGAVGFSMAASPALAADNCQLQSKSLYIMVINGLV